MSEQSELKASTEDGDWREWRRLIISNIETLHKKVTVLEKISERITVLESKKLENKLDALKDEVNNLKSDLKLQGLKVAIGATILSVIGVAGTNAVFKLVIS